MAEELVSASLFERAGGAEAISRIVEAFYLRVEDDAHMRPIYPDDLGPGKEKLKLFLAMWLGGPQTYTERFGHPRLRMRHFPFAIGARERDEWLWCMDRALDEGEMPEAVRLHLRERLHALADHMRNQAE